MKYQIRFYVLTPSFAERPCQYNEAYTIYLYRYKIVILNNSEYLVINPLNTEIFAICLKIVISFLFRFISMNIVIL